MTLEKEIGEVQHFYGKIGVASLRLEGDLRLGDFVHIVGRTTDVWETVKSMEIEHTPVTEAHAGDPVAITVPTKVHEKDLVMLAN